MPKGCKDRGKVIGVATCSITGCTSLVAATMLCGKHYQQKHSAKNLQANRRRYHERIGYSRWYFVKKRALASGIVFNLAESDVVIPAVCPALGIPILRGEGAHRDNWPSLDRLRPELGYVKGNVAVVSMRANRIKNDATLEEITKVRNWLEEILKKEAL